MEDEKIIMHIQDCTKAPHAGTGYLHSEKDDLPYNVDGVWYCGKCHQYITDNAILLGLYT